MAEMELGRDKWNGRRCGVVGEGATQYWQRIIRMGIDGPVRRCYEWKQRKIKRRKLDIQGERGAAEDGQCMQNEREKPLSRLGTLITGRCSDRQRGEGERTEWDNITT
jgi:hypothetical protein